MDNLQTLAIKSHLDFIRFDEQALLSVKKEIKTMLEECESRWIDYFISCVPDDEERLEFYILTTKEFAEINKGTMQVSKTYHEKGKESIPFQFKISDKILIIQYMFYDKTVSWKAVGNFEKYSIEQNGEEILSEEILKYALFLWKNYPKLN